jgi:hypothetical protein
MRNETHEETKLSPEREFELKRQKLLAHDKRLKRKVAVWAAVASLLIVFSTFWAVKTSRHNGPGTIVVGVDKSGTGEALGSDEHKVWVSEAQYKLDNYVYSGLGLIVGTMLWGIIILTYKKKYRRHS